MSPRRDTSLAPDELAALLSLPITGVLTTLGKDGWPHPTAMWFVPGNREVRMWTYAKSQKVRNLERDPRCAFLLEDGASYGELRGVLIQGEAQLVTGVEEIVAIGVALFDRYTSPTPGDPVVGTVLHEIERQARKRVGVAVPMERVASWDHSKL